MPNDVIEMLPFPTSHPTESTAPAQITYPVALARISELRAEYSGLKINGIDDKAGFTTVDVARKTVKSLKVAVENRRKELKAGALDYGRRVDAAAKVLFDPLEALEGELSQKQKVITDEVARIEQERLAAEMNAKQQRLNQRLLALKAIGVMLLPTVVENWTDEEFKAFLDTETAHWQAQEAQREREAQAKRDADAQAQKDREELARQRKELEEERARLEAEKRIEREKQEADERALTAERERLARAEDERLAAERKAQEEEALRVAEAERRLRQEAMRPRKQKYMDFADAIEAFALPVVDPPLPILDRMLRLTLASAAHRLREAILDAHS